jgi:hypothetical protein
MDVGWLWNIGAWLASRCSSSSAPGARFQIKSNYCRDLHRGEQAAGVVTGGLVALHSARGLEGLTWPFLE